MEPIGCCVGMAQWGTLLALAHPLMMLMILSPSLGTEVNHLKTSKKPPLGAEESQNAGDPPAAGSFLGFGTVKTPGGGHCFLLYHPRQAPNLFAEFLGAGPEKGLQKGPTSDRPVRVGTDFGNRSWPLHRTCRLASGHRRPKQANRLHPAVENMHTSRRRQALLLRHRRARGGGAREDCRLVSCHRRRRARRR